jgi:transcriptional regulator with XRE-family HTH domain
MKLTTAYINKVNSLRMIRKQLKISIKEVAENIGISRSAISQWEGFRATLSKDTISKIETYLEFKSK